MRCIASIVLALTVMAGLPADPASGQVIDPIIPGQLMLRLAPGANLSSLQSRYPQYAITTLRSVAGRGIYQLQITVPPGQNEDGIASFVEDDSPDLIVWAEPGYGGTAPEGRGGGRNFFFNQANLPGAYVDQPAWGIIRKAAANAISQGTNVKVAVVDTGIDAGHPAIAAQVLSGGQNVLDGSLLTGDVAVNADTDGDGQMDELVGHGTHVAGLIIGVAPEAEVLAIKALNSEGVTDTFLLAAGLFAAIDAGVDVINVSAGSTYDSKAIEDAVTEARSRGMLIVASAGNESTAVPFFPACTPGVVGVAALDPADVRTSFSNYNTQLALAAPGLEIYSTVPGGEYAAMDGTSMAAPLVAGAAALVLAAHPEWPRNASRASLAEAMLRAGAVNIDALNPGYVGQLGVGRLDAAAALAPRVLFQPPRFTNVGAGARQVVAGDFDGDYVVDLASADSNAGVVSILLNDRRGRFPSSTPYMVGSQPLSLAAGDLDGDGDLDLAVACAGPRRVYVLLNNGDGTFSPGGNFAVGAAPSSLVAADFDGDHDVDLAVANEDGDSVSVLRNLGGANFAAATTIPVGRDPRGLALGDLTGDGAPELVTANRRSDSITILRNNGSGVFTPTERTVGAEPRSVVIADVDGDTVPDVLVGETDVEQVRVLRNLGNASLVDLTLVSTGLRSPEAIMVADVNCDGRTDLVVPFGDAVGPAVATYLQTAAGTFAGPFDVTVPIGAFRGAIGDFDRDGDADIAAPIGPSGQVVVLLNDTCPRARKADMNCDTLVNFDDIEGFVVALIGSEAYAAQYPQCRHAQADLNDDGAVNFDDIEVFVLELVSSGPG